MHALDILGDPVRRRILEVLAQAEHSSGEVVKIIHAEFGITQAAVSQHLRVLRENGFASVRPEGAKRPSATPHAGTVRQSPGRTARRKARVRGASPRTSKGWPLRSSPS
jgi:DNA-binding transcriptional ArsR family regulator